MFKSLQWRLVGIFVMISIFMIAPIGLFLNKRIETKHYEDFKGGLERGFDVWSLSWNTTEAEMMEDAKSTSVVYNFRLDNYKSMTMVKGSTLEILYSTAGMNERDGEGFRNEMFSSHNFIPVIAGEKEIGDDPRLLNIRDKRYFDYARLVNLSDGAYVMYFRYDSEDWRRITDEFSSILLRALVLAVVVSSILGYLLSKTITMPIIRIRDKAKRIAAGEFQNPLEVNAEDEIGQLTRTFNHMAKNLKETLMEVSSEKSKVETILNYMTDGVIAFNLNGEIIHMNPAAKILLGAEDEQIKFNEFAQKFDISIALEEIIYLETLSTKEADIKIDDRYLKVYFAVFADRYRNREGIIAVLQDITKQQKLDLMRREFVANVSHELRTPLTSIKSYAEALLDGAIDDREVGTRFIEVINSEADRMTRLVKDLLQLSRLDNQQMKLNFAELNVTQMVKKSVEQLKMESVAKKQELESYVIGELPKIHGDKDRLEQVILNIISNAVKYTPEGGSITVYAGKTRNEIYIKVVDTGMGIPKKDIPRIFERFYRVDKARSRELGGTGLGLAIAKEIVEAHKGSIGISSKLDEGTEVVVRIPVKQQ